MARQTRIANIDGQGLDFRSTATGWPLAGPFFVPALFLRHHRIRTHSPHPVVWDCPRKAVSRVLLAVRKRGLAPGSSGLRLKLVQNIGCLSPFPDSLLEHHAL